MGSSTAMVWIPSCECAKWKPWLSLVLMRVKRMRLTAAGEMAMAFDQALFLSIFSVVFFSMSQMIPDIHGYSQIFPVS